MSRPYRADYIMDLSRSSQALDAFGTVSSSATKLIEGPSGSLQYQAESSAPSFSVSEQRSNFASVTSTIARDIAEPENQKQEEVDEYDDSALGSSLVSECCVALSADYLLSRSVLEAETPCRAIYTVFKPTGELWIEYVDAEKRTKKCFFKMKEWEVSLEGWKLWHCDWAGLATDICIKYNAGDGLGERFEKQSRPVPLVVVGYLFQLNLPPIQPLRAALELISLAICVLSTEGFEGWLDLMQERLTYEPIGHPLPLYLEDTSQAIDILNTFLSTCSNSSDDRIFMSLLTVLGSLDIVDLSCDFQGLETLLASTRLHFDSIFNSGKDFQRVLAAKGLATLVTWGFLERKEGWKDVAKLGTREEFKYAENVKEGLLAREEWRRKGCIVVLAELGIIEQCELSTLIAECHDIDALIMILSKGHAASVDESSLIATVNNCLSNVLSIAQLSALVSLLSIHPSLHPLFASSNFPYHLPRYMSSPTLLPALLPLLSSSDFLRFYPSIDLSNIVDHLLIEGKCSPFTVCEYLLKPLKTPIDDMLLQWVGLVLGWSKAVGQGVAEAVIRVEMEMRRIQEWLMPSTGERVVERLDKEGEWVLAWAEGVGEAEVETIRKAYLKLCRTKFLTYDKATRTYQRSLYSAMLRALQLLDQAIAKTRPRSEELFKELANGILKLEENVKEADVVNRLLSNPCYEDCWKLLHKHSHLLPSSPYLLSLLQCLHSLAEELITFKATFRTMDRIENMSEENRIQLLAFLNIAIETEGVIKAQYSACKSTLSTLHSFLAFLYRLDLSPSALHSALQAFETQLPNTSLGAFALPKTLQDYYDMSITLQPLFNSGLFAYMIEMEKSRMSLLQLFSIRQAQELCRAAKTRLITYITTLTASIDTTLVTDMLPYFTLTTDINAEIQLIQHAVNGVVGLNKVAECLTIYRQREYWKAVFRGLTCIHACGLLSLLDVHIQSMSFDPIGQSISSYIETSRASFAHLAPLPPTAQPFFDLLAALNKKKMITFAVELTPEDLEKLREAATDLDSATLNSLSVRDIGLLNSYLKVVKSQALPEFLVKGADLMAEYAGVLEACVNLKSSWKALKSELVTYNTSLHKLKIDAILTQTTVNIYEDSRLDVGFSIGDMHYIDLPALEELKDREDLYYQVHKGYRSVLVDKRFTGLVNSLQLMKKTVGRMRSVGMPGLRLSIAVEGGDWVEVGRKSEEIGSLLSEWERALDSQYLSSPVFTFFHSSHFWTLESYLFFHSPEHQAASLHLLHRAGLSHVSPLPAPLSDIPSPTDRLHRLLQYIHNSCPPHFPEPPKLDYQPEKGIKIAGQGRVIYVETKAIVEAVISVYANGEGRMGKAWQVLWCRKETVWGEVMTFFYRCFTWGEAGGTVFSIVECENLSVEMQRRAKSLFEQLYRKKGGNMQSSLAVITKEEHCILSFFFKTLESPAVFKLLSTQLIQNPALLRSIIQQIDPLTLYVYSSLPGDGKTFWIQKQANELEKELITVHLTGEIDLEEVVSTLQTHISHSKALHLRLGPHLQSAQVEYLLASLVLFRTLTAGDKVASLGFSHIYIEAESSFDSPFLGFLRTFRVEFSLEDVKITPEMSFISSYLYLFDMGMLDSSDISSAPPTLSLIQQQLNLYFVRRQQARSQPVTYRNLIIFSKVLSSLLANMEKGLFTRNTLPKIIGDLTEFGLKRLAQDCAQLRGKILEGMLTTVEEVNTMTLSKVYSIRDNKRYNRNSLYESGNHFLALFLEDGSFIPVYRQAYSVPRYISQLIYLQAGLERQTKSWLPGILKRLMLRKEIEAGEIEVEDYGKMTSSQLISRLHDLFSTPSPAPAGPQSDYIMTSDNFVKMMLIYLRALSHLPIVIMGETGCGKTYLIQYFVENILRERLKVVSVHAGVSKKMLVSMVEEMVKEAEQEKRLWIFLDEFNTSDAVGVISEVICERQIEHITVPSNVVIVAACNPYRYKPPAFFQEDIGLSRPRQSSRLVHLVNPLPDSLVDYIWDFGVLSQEDTNQYIGAMVGSMDLPERLQPICSSLLFEAHKYFQEIDGSMVSLRDVGRFRKMVAWFKGSMRVRVDMMGENSKAFFSLHSLPYPWPNLLDITELSLLLAFCTCYLLRISNRSSRQQFLISCLSAAKWIDYETAKEVITGNENDILGRMRIPQGVALNEALRENVCTLFQCVYAGVPVILCGKPGCSKSLSVQILLSSCLGPQSLDSYLRLLPRLHAVPFQGSETCTSAGIDEAFNTANRLRQTSKEDILPVLLFEEIGSAELSPHNPLKILHSMLETEKVEIGFVGLSNWKLDASKMNRVVYLARPEPREEDLVTTAESLVIGGRTDNKEIVKGLARAYVAFKRQMEETVFSDFFGLRDFYHLVRQVTHFSSLLPLSDQQGLYRCIQAAVQRNFSGYDPAPSLFMSLFTPTSYLIPADIQPLSPLELVLMNLKDPEARNLMLISKGDAGMFIVETAVKAVLPRFKVFIGSQLAEDTDAEDYAKSILKQIISCIEQGVPVLMKSLKGVWSGLYDLFNQNYMSEGGRKYCQVALGHCYCPRRPVHPAFKAIVFLEDETEDLVRTDAAFVNRFEKQKIALEDILQPGEREIVRKLEDWLGKLIGKSGMEVRTVVPLYSPEWLRLIVRFGDGERDCLREIVKIASEDILLLASISDLDEEKREFIKETWDSTHLPSIQALLLSHFSREPPNLTPNMLVFLPDGTEIPTDLLLRGKRVNQRHISAFTSEKALEEDLAAFYASDTPAYLLSLSVSLHSNHLTWLKYMLDKACLGHIAEEKVVCVLAYTSRNANYAKEEVWWFKSWLVGAYCPAHIYPLLSLSSKEVLFRFKPRFLSIFPSLLQSAYHLFRFKANSAASNHVKFIQEWAPRHPELVQAFQTKVFSLLQSPTWAIKDWKQAICCDLDIVSEARESDLAVNLFAEREMRRALVAVLYVVEKLQAFSSYFYTGDGGNIIRSIWIRRFLAVRIPETLSTEAISLEIAQIQLLFPFSLSDIHIITDKFPLYSDFPVQLQVQNYRKLTQYREELGQLGSEEVGDLYIGDFLRVERGTEMVEIAVELHRMVSMCVKDLEMRTICYFHYKSLVQTVIQILTVLKCMQPELFPTISELKLMQKTLLSQLFGTPFPSVLSLSEDFCSRIGLWLQGKCLKCRPSMQLFQRVGSLCSYSQQLQTLFSLLKRCCNQYNFHLLRLCEVEFWWLLSKYAWMHGLSPASLAELSNLAETAPIPEDFMYFQPFRRAVLELIGKKGDLEAQRSFRTGYFHLLLLDHSDVMEDIARDIEEAGDIRCFSRIIGLIITLTGLNKPESLLKNLETLEENSYLKKLEEILGNIGVCCRFGVLLGDWISRKVSKKRRKCREKEYLERYFEEFQTSYLSVQQSTEKYKAISTLLCLSFIRVYLDNYAFQLLIDAEDSSLQLFDAVEQDSVPLIATFRLYILKVIKRKGALSLRELQNWISGDKARTWTLINDMNTGEQPLAPLGRGQSDLFWVTYHQLEFLLKGKGDHDLRPEILRIHDPATKLDFLTAAFTQLYSVSSPRKSTGLDSPAVSKLLEDHLGRIGASYFHLIRRNFEGSFLRIQADSSEEERWRTRLIGLFWAVLSAYADVEGPLTSPFFASQERGYQELSQSLSQFYLSGAESLPLYSELVYTLANFDMLKSEAWKTWRQKWVKGSAYRCSDTCDYVYFVESCGAPMKKGVCPYCKAQIGGVDHKVVKRHGHVNLSDEEAKSYLREALDRYRASEPSGYVAYGPNRPFLMSVRPISVPCYHLLHLFLNSTLYLLYLTHTVPEASIASLLPTTHVEKYFKDTIEADLAALTLPMDREHVFVWIEAIIASLPQVFSFSPLPTSLASRLAFEQHFDMMVIQPRLPYPDRSVADYKAQCSLIGVSGLTVIEEIGKDETKYPYCGLFRMRGEGEWDRMSAAFKLRKLGAVYPLLDVFISYKTEFDRLACLYPLVRLTNHLLEKFSHNVSRDDARYQSIGEALLCDPTGLSHLHSFLTQWNDLQPFPLQYQCKTIDFLPLSDRSELCYFLPDNKELGGGMIAAAALISLASIHNKLITSYTDLRKLEKKQEMEGIPVQRMREDMAFRIDFSSKSYLQAWSHNNPDYGRGCELVYDYQEMENHLSEQISRTSILTSDPLTLIQYQFELQNLDSEGSSVISEIRVQVPQKMMTIEVSQVLITALMGVKDKSTFDFPKELRRLYSSLEYLLSCLKTFQGDLTIGTLCSHLDPAKVHPMLSSDLGRIGLEYLVGIYEEVEERYFPYLRSFVRREHVREMERDRIEKVVKKVEMWSCRDENVSLPILCRVLLRLIARCLTGEANPTLALEMYITRPDFWPEDVSEEERLEFAHLLEEVPLACSLQLYDGLAGCMKRLVQAGLLGWE